MRTANQSLGPGGEEISLPASHFLERDLRPDSNTRTAVHGQSLQAHTIPNSLSQLHRLWARWRCLFLKAIIAGHRKSTS